MYYVVFVPGIAFVIFMFFIAILLMLALSIPFLIALAAVAPYIIILFICYLIWDDHFRGCSGSMLMLIITALLCSGVFHFEHDVFNAATQSPTMYVPKHVQIHNQYNQDVIKNLVGPGTTAKESYDNGVMIKEPNVNSAKQEAYNLSNKIKSKHLNLSRVPVITFYREKSKLIHHLDKQQVQDSMGGQKIPKRYKHIYINIGTVNLRAGHYSTGWNYGEKITYLAQKKTTTNKIRIHLYDVTHNLERTW